VEATRDDSPLVRRLAAGDHTAAFDPWAVEVIADVLTTAAENGEIPAQARRRTGLSQPEQPPLGSSGSTSCDIRISSGPHATSSPATFPPPRIACF
jgi:hypothetical protein